MYVRKSLRNALNEITANIKSNIPLLINGETGVGKEVLANLIHKNYKRKGEFISFLSSCIPESLFESELFGYKRGAFTGADTDKEGLIEKANNGTLFIDEIASLPYNFQSKFLRVLDTKKFRRLGETDERFSNFTLICATNSDLGKLKEEKKFRIDLYFRIKGKIIDLPPLRDEDEEIFLLLESFIKELKKETKFSENIQELLLCYKWPGNTRELKRFAEICSDRDIIELKDLPLNFFEKHCFLKQENRKMTIEEKVLCFKEKLIINYLKSGGCIKGLCKELGKSEVQIRRILKKLNIKFKSKRGRPIKNSIKSDKISE